MNVPVVRTNGSDGRVTVEYRTKEGSTASAGYFQPTSGTLTFQHGETRSSIRVPLNPEAWEQGECIHGISRPVAPGSLNRPESELGLISSVIWPEHYGNAWADF